jgi:hypothetical protein
VTVAKVTAISSINQKIYDLLVRGEESANANCRNVILPIDLPITKGLQAGGRP